ncbi:MAG: hypothetical protein ACI897_000755 [Flavobacteriales bacterium]|jgi:hypothetical protein|tara:strand:- start:542 stop:757 length:216 start_codon:yes stop_codon:yes gene_type:complete
MSSGAIKTNYSKEDVIQKGLVTDISEDSEDSLVEYATDEVVESPDNFFAFQVHFAFGTFAAQKLSLRWIIV